MTGRAASVLALAILSLGCPSSKQDEQASQPAPPKTTKPKSSVVYRSHRAMGTQITITAWADDEPKAVSLMKNAFREFERLDDLLTVWRKDSDVSRINDAAGKAPVKVAPQTIEVLEHSIRLAKLTKGKFDVTFGTLAGLWRFDHDQDNKIPSSADVQDRLSKLGYERIVLDAEAGTAFLKTEGTRLHLGGIGKGYAVDRAVAILREGGLDNFMVQAGGDLFVSGKKGDRPWRVGIRDPRGPPSKFFAFATVTDETFSTSGDYERFFEKDGIRYHHIIDPDTGQPARKCRSVTVMTRDAVSSDALSTGIFILGAEAGLALIESISGAGAVIIDADNQVHVSTRLRDRIKRVAPLVSER